MIHGGRFTLSQGETQSSRAFAFGRLDGVSPYQS
jgi:hypothetical protein